MDYSGLYDDLVIMRRNGVNALKACELAEDEKQAQRWDDFLWEVETFMDLIVVRRWR